MLSNDANLTPISWQTGTVERIVAETYRAKTFTIRLPDWRAFKAGQHYDVRLTAPDGYQAQRSYSIASAPDTEGVIDLTVELIDDGEVSPYFHGVLQVGDELELRGPIGGPFTWAKDTGGPLLLIAGGSGVVPLMSMLRHRRSAARDVSCLMLYSSRSHDDVIYHTELDVMCDAAANLAVIHTLTRAQPADWNGYSRRIDRPMLEDALSRLEDAPHTYVCGPTAFVESVADALLELNVPGERIRTERFGPTG